MGWGCAMAEQVNTATARAILREIAIGSLRVSRQAGQAIEKADDSSAVDALNNAIQVMTLRMGWLAEVAAQDIGEQHEVVGFDALDWMMPTMSAAAWEVPSHG